MIVVVVVVPEPRSRRACLRSAGDLASRWRGHVYMGVAPDRRCRRLSPGGRERRCEGSWGDLSRERAQTDEGSDDRLNPKKRSIVSGVLRSIR